MKQHTTDKEACDHCKNKNRV